jgi:hypothetical protein
MNSIELSIALLTVSALAGFLGALTGLGGGVVLVPALTLLFGVDLRYAIGASLVSVIATSSGAAAAYVREGYSNIRIGMFLEIATCIGAVGGAYLATFISTGVIGVIFGFVLIYSAYLSFQRGHADATPSGPPDPIAESLGLHGKYPVDDREEAYTARRPILGLGVMGIAGVLSGLLGIGSGAVKVIAMDHIMGLPFKVSTTTSNFMIGVTAAASAGIYFSRGYIDPSLAMPVMLGVLGGSLVGAKTLMGARSQSLRTVFACTIVLLGLEMFYKGLTGKI